MQGHSRRVIESALTAISETSRGPLEEHACDAKTCFNRPRVAGVSQPVDRDRPDGLHAERPLVAAEPEIPRVPNPPLASDLANLPGDLRGIAVPGPTNLGDFVKDVQAARALGKALFWDMNVGSDGCKRARRVTFEPAPTRARRISSARACSGHRTGSRVQRCPRP